MADFAPVATQIQPPNPMQGLQAYSTLLGIRQQNLDYQRGQQQLQTGAIQQQGLQAQTSQLQQQNQEMQQAGQLLQKVHGGGYRNKDGTLDRGTLADDLASIGPYAGEASSRMLSQANEIVQNQTAKQSLTDASRTALGDTLHSLATNPGTTRGDVVEAVTNFMVAHRDDPSAFRVAAAQLALLPQNDQDPRFRQVLSNFAGSLTGKSQSTPTTIDTGGSVIPGAALGATGAFTPASTDKQGNPVGITKGLAPTEQPGYKAQLSGVEADSQTYTAARIADAHAPRVIALAKALQGMSSQGSAAVANNPALAKTLRSLGVESAGVANTAIMDKLTATLSRELMAAPRSDADQHEIQNMLPDVSKGPEAVRAAADQIIQRAQYDQGKLTYMEKHGISNSRPMGAADAENAYTRSTAAPPTSKQAAPGAAKEGASGKSKSGKPIVYRNGRWEYQQ